MKKIFIVAGELSGDRVGAWYVKKFLHEDVSIEAVGGDFLQKAGVNIFHRFEDLNVTGVVEVVKKLPFIFKFLKRLATYIVDNAFDEVILVDFPGFNLMLAKKLKAMVPSLVITYLSPPQLWCWGAWRAKKLKRYCNQLIVLYPFEVQWYASRGINAYWMGSPVYDSMENFFSDADLPKQNCIAIIPGSRESEIEQMFGFFAGVMKSFFENYPDVTCIIPFAQSLSQAIIEQKLCDCGLEKYRERITIVCGEEQKFRALSRCCLAVCKPGTVTLELALLGVPAVILFKTSRLTYLLARPLVKVTCMSLPNLLFGSQVYKECIQGECSVDHAFEHAQRLYQSYLSENVQYFDTQKKLIQLRDLLVGGKK
ncbi:MAG: lipid-A-disaccharide synthase [bacterium]